MRIELCVWRVRVRFSVPDVSLMGKVFAILAFLHVGYRLSRGKKLSHTQLRYVIELLEIAVGMGYTKEMEMLFTPGFVDRIMDSCRKRRMCVWRIEKGGENET